MLPFFLLLPQIWRKVKSQRPRLLRLTANGLNQQAAIGLSAGTLERSCAATCFRVLPQILGRPSRGSGSPPFCMPPPCMAGFTGNPSVGKNANPYGEALSKSGLRGQFGRTAIVIRVRQFWISDSRLPFGECRKKLGGACANSATRNVSVKVVAAKFESRLFFFFFDVPGSSGKTSRALTDRRSETDPYPATFQGSAVAPGAAAPRSLARFCANTVPLFLRREDPKCRHSFKSKTRARTAAPAQRVPGNPDCSDTQGTNHRNALAIS